LYGAQTRTEESFYGVHRGLRGQTFYELITYYLLHMLILLDLG